MSEAKLRDPSSKGVVRACWALRFKRRVASDCAHAVCATDAPMSDEATGEPTGGAGLAAP